MSKFLDQLDGKLQNSDLESYIQMLVIENSVEILRENSDKDEKITTLFNQYISDLSSINALNQKNVQAVLLGLKRALIKDDEKEIFDLIYQYDRLKKEIFSKRANVKFKIKNSFTLIENIVKSDENANKDEILPAINEILLNELEMSDVLKEASELAFVSVVEHGSDIEDTARETAKNIAFYAINGEEFSVKRIKEISKIIISQAVLVANESKNYADELIRGAVFGCDDGIEKVIEKFREKLDFAPDEVAKNLHSVKDEITSIDEVFNEVVKEISQNSQDPAKSVLEDVLQNDLNGYMAKFRKISGEFGETLSKKMDEFELDAKYKELSKNASEKFDEIKQDLNKKSAEIIDKMDLDEKLADFKKEFGEIEKKVSAKFNEFKNSEMAQNLGEKAKEFGLRAYEAAKNSIEKMKNK